MSGSDDTTTRIWDAETGAQLAALIGGRGADWLAMTPAGFFGASRGNTQVVAIARGMEVYPVAQFQDHLYRADLVEAVLNGDPEGKYADAASKLNLQIILDSGPAPQIEILREICERFLFVSGGRVLAYRDYASLMTQPDVRTYLAEGACSAAFGCSSAVR